MLTLTAQGIELCLQASAHHNTLLAALQDCQNAISGPVALYTMDGFCQGLTQLGEDGCRQYDLFCTTEGVCLLIYLLDKHMISHGLVFKQIAVENASNEK